MCKYFIPAMQIQQIQQILYNKLKKTKKIQKKNEIPLSNMAPKTKI